MIGKDWIIEYIEFTTPIIRVEHNRYYISNNVAVCFSDSEVITKELIGARVANALNTEKRN